MDATDNTDNINAMCAGTYNTNESCLVYGPTLFCFKKNKPPKQSLTTKLRIALARKILPKNLKDILEDC